MARGTIWRAGWRTHLADHDARMQELKTKPCLSFFCQL